MQQQQQPSPLPMAPAAPVPTMTTEQIQKLLDENKQLILAILENQNLGKLSECAQYQSLLQKNLSFLAAIADSQPNASTVRPQMMPHGAMPPGGHYMQQQLSFPPRALMQLNRLQMQELQQQQQHLHLKSAGIPFPGQMGIGPGAINGMQSMHAETSHGGNADLRAAPHFGEFPQGSNIVVDARVNKQDSHASGSASEPVGADGQRSSGTEHEGGDAAAAAAQTHMRRPEDAKTS